MRIIDRNTLLELLICSKQDNYAIGQVIKFANDFILDENEEVEYTDDFIKNFSNLMLYFDTEASNDREKFKVVVDYIVESLKMKKNLLKEDIEVLLKS